MQGSTIDRNPSTTAAVPSAGRLTPAQRSLLWLNGLGGFAVLASYVVAFNLAPEVRSGLWGGVPEGWRPIYTTNMFLAAAGYFPLTALVVFATTPGRFRGETGLDHGWLARLYTLVLIPSALWVPLTAVMIRAPSTTVWIAIVVVLAAVGVGTTGLAYASLRIALRRGGALAWAGFAGSLPFWFQTAVLDATVWTFYYPR